MERSASRDPLRCTRPVRIPVPEVIPVALPPLSPEQRAAALAKAAAARSRRAEVKHQLKHHQIRLSEVLDGAREDEALAKLRVVELLESMPGVGKIKSRSIMADIGISDARRVQGLGRKQVTALLELFG